MGRVLMAAASPTELDADLERALVALGASPEEPALDAFAAPLTVAAALGKKDPGSPFLLRAAPALTGASGTHGPVPAPAFWLRGEAGSKELRVAPAALSGGAKAGSARVASVVVEAAEDRCCDAAACSSRRTLASAWIELERASDGIPSRLRFTEAADLDPARARARALVVARAMADLLGAPITTAIDDAAVELPTEPAAPALVARKLARFTMSAEGDRVVLRDHASLGPAGSASGKAVFGISMLVIAAPLWIEAARAFSRGDRNLGVGLSALAALATLAGYAFTSIARYSRRYHARSTPLFWVGRDRFVVAPWVSRAGAVDKLPEGRIGAAIALEEVRGVSAQPRDGFFAVEVDSDHGPMDVLASDDEAVAAFWAAAIRRSLADFAHPKARASARKRARERAA